METFDIKHIKNVALLGHTGSGKTTLIEAMLFEAGIINKRGTIAGKNTMGDFTDMEKEKGKTFFSKLLNTKWKGFKINLLDTPGSDDLASEIITSMKVADCGLVLLNAKMGVEVLTDILWEYADDYKLPLIFAVNHLDHELADFDKTVNEAKAHFGHQVVIVQYPFNQGPKFNGIIDVLNMVYYKYPENGGVPEKLAIPESEQEKANQLHKDLIETIASNDENLMELYFEKGELNEDEMKLGLHHSLIKHEIFPVFCVSADKNMGAGRLMSFIDNVCPSAYEMPEKETKDGRLIKCSDSEKSAIFIYKTVTEPHVGDISFFKVLSGKVKVGDELANENTNQVERISHLYEMEGNKRFDVQELVAGDIGATPKLKDTHTNNTLHEKGYTVELPAIAYPEPIYTIAIEGKKGEEDKLSTALHQLVEEDPSVVVEISSETKQTIIHCLGELHLQVIKWKLEHFKNLTINFVPAKISYRETIAQTAETVYRHKKQSGGAGQFGEISMIIDPWYEGMPEPNGLSIRGVEKIVLPWGGHLVYYNCIVGGAIDNRFHSAIQKGIIEKMNEGPLTGSPVNDVRVIIFDGKMHAVDSNDMAFKLAGMMGFKECFLKANPQLQEPIFNITITAPEDTTGVAMQTMQTHRALVEGIDVLGHFSEVKGQIPQAELMPFFIDIKALTQGRVKVKTAFSHYENVPYDVQQKIVESRKADLVEN